MIRARTLVLGLLGLGTALLAGCGVPSPRAYTAEPIEGPWRVAVLPLVNYSTDSQAPDRVTNLLASQLRTVPGVAVIDAGAVEDALAREPWLLTDRIPPDLVDSLGATLHADALLVGSVLAFGYREEPWGGTIPEFAVSLRLIETPGGRVRWGAHHGRDGADGEGLFGIGRVATLDQLVIESLEQILDTFPEVRSGISPGSRIPGEQGSTP